MDVHPAVACDHVAVVGLAVFQLHQLRSTQHGWNGLWGSRTREGQGHDASLQATDAAAAPHPSERLAGWHVIVGHARGRLGANSCKRCGSEMEVGRGQTRANDCRDAFECSPQDGSELFSAEAAATLLLLVQSATPSTASSSKTNVKLSRAVLLADGASQWHHGRTRRSVRSTQNERLCRAFKAAIDPLPGISAASS